MILVIMLHTNIILLISVSLYIRLRGVETTQELHILFEFYVLFDKFVVFVILDKLEDNNFIEHIFLKIIDGSTFNFHLYCVF